MKHYMTPTPHSVGDEMPLKTASELMRRYDIRHLPVQHAGRLVGIVSERDIAVAASVHPSAVDLKVGEVMYPQPYAVSADEPLDEALFQMVRNKYGSVVVTNDKGRAVGIFTMTDAARYLAQSVDERRRGATPGLSTASDGRPSGERAGSIAEVMTHSPHCVSKGTTLGKARILMRKKGVRHLPITDEKGHVVGIISERDLEFAALYPDFLSLPVDRFLVAPPYVVNKEAPLDEVIEEMIRQKYGCTIVIDAERVPIGIFTSIDALELLHRLVTTGSAAPPPEKEPTAAPAA